MVKIRMLSWKLLDLVLEPRIVSLVERGGAFSEDETVWGLGVEEGSRGGWTATGRESTIDETGMKHRFGFRLLCDVSGRAPRKAVQ